MITLVDLTKRYGPLTAVDGLSIEVPQGQTCVLIGPSGCGKTTTLKMINRLIEPTSGRIVIDGEDVTDTDPVALRRRIGYVIQHVGLFPHMTIGANVGTVPRLLGWDKPRIARRVDELLDLVGLDPAMYRDRYPDQLSGGQRQRVGVARALGADPPVLLMDEPFGAIDPINRERLQNEFLRLQAEVRKTVVLVTHDIDEAITLGDRVCVLRENGVLAQYDTPSAILAEPASAFVAEFVGADRGLKRLAVTAVEPELLEHPPVVAPDTTLAEARALLERSASTIVLVAGRDGRADGWLNGGDAAGEGTAADRMRPLPGTVAAGTSLKDALGALLLDDAGWVAVVDDDRTVGIVSAAGVHHAARAGSDR